MSSEVLTIRVQSELKSKLDKLGKALDRSKSYLAEQAISQYLEENAWQIEEMLNIKKEIKAAKFVENDKVLDYLNSWGTDELIKAPKSK